MHRKPVWYMFRRDPGEEIRIFIQWYLGGGRRRAKEEHKQAVHKSLTMKRHWPELVGQPVDMAREVIRRENPSVSNVRIFPVDTPLRDDLRIRWSPHRIYLFVEPDNTIAEVPEFFKSFWPELAGQPGNLAKEVIQRENPMVFVVLYNCGTPICANYCSRRVMVFITSKNLVSGTPECG